MQRLLFSFLATTPLLFSQTSTVFLPHMVDGSGWKTIFTVTNLSPLSGSATMNFHGEDGSPVSVNLNTVPGAPVTSTQISAGPHSVQTIETAGTSTSTTSGWVEFVVNASTAPLFISAVIRRHVSATADYEASVFSTPGAAKPLVIPFDNTAGFATGIAAMNGSSALPANVGVLIRDASGNQLQTDTLSFTPGSHTAFLIGDKYKAATTGIKGSIELDPDLQGGPLGVIALRFNPTGAFTTIQVLSQ